MAASMVEQLKQRGNTAFAAGEFGKAITLYTSAIEKDGGVSHVLFSNRSAAYLARNEPGDALAAISDANAAIKLEPGFAKAYHRKGCALIAIGEYEDAIAIFQRGIGIDPANQALKDGLNQANAALASKRMKEAVEAQQQAAEAKKAKESASNKQGSSIDDAFAEFEAELAGLAAEKKDKPAAAQSKSESELSKKSDTDLAADIAAYFDAEAEDTWDAAASKAAGDDVNNGSSKPDSDSEGEEGASTVTERSIIAHSLSSTSSAVSINLDPAAGLTDKERAEQTARLASQDLGTGTSQIDRIMGKNHAWINLNPYDVMMLPFTAAEEDIKARFRKLSALVHPDKNVGDDRANDAFNEVRKAQETLLDGAKRNIIIAVIKQAHKGVKKVRRRKLRAGVPESSLPPLDSELLRETRKAFAEREMRRRNYENRVKAEAAREAAEEFEAQQAAKEEHKAETEWATGRDRRMESWQSFQHTKKRKLGEDGATMQSDAIRFAAGANVPDYKKKWR